MNKSIHTSRWAAGFAAALFASLTVPALAQAPSTAERVASLKASLAMSQVVLKQYEWIETTVVSLKGKEKSRKQERCYYGADGAVQKVTLTPPPPEKKVRGPLRRAIAENKKEELTDYMKSAVALVKTYVPPNPAQIQLAKDAGNVSIDMLEPGKRARLNFRNFVKPGDNLGAEVDLTSNQLLAVSVKTYLEDAKDAVTLNVTMGKLNDGTTYSKDVVLNAKAKTVTVNVQNGGYRKMGN